MSALNVRNKFFVFLLLIFFIQTIAAQRSLRERWEFLMSFFKDPYKIGSITPSSVYLARAMTKHIQSKNHKIKILEVGAGTGVFTKEIVEKLGDSDYELDVIEIDEGLREILKKNFGNNSKVKIHTVSILDWKRDTEEYNFIISGLPFNYFDSEIVKTIVDNYWSMIRFDGVISYFEYIGMSAMKPYFLGKERRQDFKFMLDILSGFRQCFDIEVDRVIRNVFPAHVYHLKPGICLDGDLNLEL